jgi:death-on-curing protein
MLDVEFVIFSHDKILDTEPGLPGFAASGRGGVVSALHRVENYAAYEGLDDVFGIAALYAIAIARGHVFNDGNKRTALICALAYLSEEGITIRRNPLLEQLMVDVADGDIEHAALASFFAAIADLEEAQMVKADLDRDFEQMKRDMPLDDFD